MLACTPIRISPQSAGDNIISEQYRRVILETCKSAYKSDVDSLTKLAFSHLKDDNLSTCQATRTRHSPSKTNDDVQESNVETDMTTILEQAIPDPELKHPMSQRVVGEIIRYFGDLRDKFPYEATAACQASYRCKILWETLNFAHIIPKPSNQDAKSDDELAVAFMRSTGCGPLDASFDDCSYEWARQYRAAKTLTGFGKSSKTIPLREQALKPNDARHSSACIHIPIITDRTMQADPYLKEKMYVFVEAFLSDSDWAEVQDQGQETCEQHLKVMEHCKLTNIGLNPVFGYERLCEVQRQVHGQLVQPGWICTVALEERRRLLLALTYSDYGINTESHQDLMEDEGRRLRARLGGMIIGCNYDSYDEWASGEVNVSNAICGDCFVTEAHATCSPDRWDSEDYNFEDRWQYGGPMYFTFSLRHNHALARLLNFQAHDVESILASYNNFPEQHLQGKANCELLESISSAIGIQIKEDEFGDRIGRQYDWATVSGMCADCNRNGGASEWYLATLGLSLGAMQLSLLEKIRLAHYVDSIGVNVFPELHRSYISGCGCVARWIKRHYMVTISASRMWDLAKYNPLLALRDHLASSITGLDDNAIVILLGSANKKLLVGRKLGQEYRDRREAALKARREFQ
ncbi:hypothetical protein BGZ83_012039 [Gryganskiella cystojenkinii]|nr:hypothetical protein BGZ83_012039 [Gryganskiella cystojenkinii]